MRDWSSDVCSRSEVIPRFESIHDPFKTITGQGNFAVGARTYIPNLKWMSINIGLKTWVFRDEYEPGNRGPATDQNAAGETVDDPALDNAANAKKAAEKAFAFNSMFFVGVSFYIPPTFEYSTRR